MFLSKIWFILVALVASVATTVALVAPRSASRHLASAEAQSLDRAQYAAEQQLKNDAIRWIQSVAKLGRDAVITETLENATRGNGESSVLNETIRGRLGSLVPDLDSRGIRVLAAVDGNGRIVGRIGEGENNRDAELVSGLEVVSDALRGYMSDDVWGSNGKLTRVAAAPVLSKAKDKVVGAIYVGLDTGDRMVELWRKNLGVDVAILLGGQVLSSSVPEGALGSLADRVKDHQDEIKGAHRTKAFTLPHGNDELLAVAAPFAGQASAMGAHYVLMVKQTQAGGPLELLASTTKEDLGWAVFPWLRLGGAVLLIIGVGLFLQRREMEKPLGVLRSDVQKLARGELQKLDDHKHPGRFGAIARDVNAALERFIHGDGAHDNKKDLSAILGDRGGRSVDLPSLPPLGSPSSTSGFGPQKTPGGFSNPAPTPVSFPGAPSFGPPPSFGQASGAAPGAFSMPPPSGPMPIPGATPNARLSSPPLSGPSRPTPAANVGPGLGGAMPPRPMAAPPAAPAFGGGAPANAHGYSNDGGPTPTVPMPAASTGSLQAARGAMPTAQADDSPTANMNNGAPAPDPDEAHMREVFAEYVAVRSQTGESTRGLTLEKFRERLEENRKAIVAKYNCRGARFAVYVKDGKAAIRATPVKD
ncbi:MAG: MXAN_5187 family protein [Deltaproteobacteria bacterium]|nr:MXAN_5187 family protein [Deltaproteobacteria bacterium]